MTPWAELAGRLVDSQAGPGGLDAGVNVYEAPVEQVTVPAIVIRPDAPWRSPDRFCDDLQRYVAIAVVTASAPADGIAALLAMTSAIIEVAVGGADSPWGWTEVRAPIIDDTTGVPFLASAVALTYRHGGTAP